MADADGDTSISSSNDSGSYATEEEDQSIATLPVSKKTKYTGSFKYKTKFSKEWTKEWPFVSAVPHKPNMFRCNICQKNLSCGHQGSKDIKEHVATQAHRNLAKQLKNQPKISFSTESDPVKQKVMTTLLKLISVNLLMNYYCR